jgi:EmrB/QacA subfamily drug resistance transporter
MIDARHRHPAPEDLHGGIPAGVYARRWPILAVLCVALLIVGIDGTIVNVALPSFVRELHASPSQLQWISDGYTLVFASFLLTAGTLGDKFGRKGALLFGLVVFGVGSLGGALVGSAGALIATRAVQGFGGAFIMPATLSILTNVFPDEERGRAIGIWAGVSGLGVAVGPLVGGYLLDHFWWGSVFLVNLPVIAIALVAVVTIVPSSKDPNAKPIDVLGTVLSVGTLTGILYGIIEGPNQGWTATGVLIGFVGGAVLLLAFILWELHTPDPMLDVGFFKNPRFSAASIAVTFVFFALFGSIFFLTQYIQFVLGFTPLQAGEALIPVAFALMVSAPTSSFLVARVGTKAIVTMGLLIVASSLTLLSTATTTSGYGLIAAVLVLLGLGMGLAMAPATDSIMGSLPREKAGVGSAVNDTTREVGGALGVAILGSILAATYSASARSSTVVKALSATGAQGAKAGAAVASSIGGASQVAQQVAQLERLGKVPVGTAQAIVDASNHAFVHAMGHTVLVGAVIAALGALVALVFLPARPITTRSDVEELGDLGQLVVRGARALPTRPARDRDLLGITLQLLTEAGFSSLSFHGIASRAGISTGTIEREWNSKLDLVIAALTTAFAEHPIPDTGSFRADCRAYLRETAEGLATPGSRPLIADLLGDSARDQAMTATFRRRLIEPRHRAVTTMVNRAIARHELAPDVDASLIVDTLVGPLYHRLLITGAPISAEVADEIVDVVLHGARRQ